MENAREKLIMVNQATINERLNAFVKKMGEPKTRLKPRGYNEEEYQLVLKLKGMGYNSKEIASGLGIAASKVYLYNKKKALDDEK